MSDNPSLTPEDPIDVEFEPAAPKSKHALISGGPGWPAFGLLAFISAISLALAAMAVGWLPNFSGSASSVKALRQSVTDTRADVNGAEAEISDLTSRIETMSAVSQQNRATDRQLSERLDAIETTLAELQSGLDSVNKQLGEMTPATGRDGEPLLLKINPEILNRLDKLEAGLEAAKAATPPPAVPGPKISSDLSADIAALKAEIEAFKSSGAQAQAEEDAAKAGAAEAALALSAIEAAARRGRPFLSAYQSLSDALPEDAAVKSLAPLAVSGAPTLADLRVRFAPLRGDALAQNAKANGEASGWFQSIFGDGITVRREGEVLAVDLLDAAEAALASGELTAAISAVERLPEPVQIVFTDWLEGANERQSLETALEALRLTMISKGRL